jgi:peptidoglycan hydrolase CwlO-like protein
MIDPKIKHGVPVLVCILLVSSFFGTHLRNGNAQSIDQIERDIKEYESTLGRLRDEQASLANEIEQFDIQAKKIAAEITKTEEELNQLEDNIELTETKIETTKNNIGIQEETLSNYIQLIDQSDDTTFIEAVFSANSLSGIVDNIQYSTTLQKETRATLTDYKTFKHELEEQKIQYNTSLDETEVLLRLLAQQENDLEIQKQNKEALLEQTQGEEEKYQELVADAQTKKQDIIASLISTSTSSGGLSIEEAARYATAAEAQTGVRKEVIMAVIEQETYFGRNVGTGTYSVDMRPSLRPKFEQVCAELGIDPNSTPVSKKPQTYQGWGGAMGYAQIMPPEWLSIKNEITSLTGNPRPSPWNPADAFMGAALILKNKGAANPETEFEGVARYFAGGYWQKYSWYATSVLKKAEKYR